MTKQTDQRPLRERLRDRLALPAAEVAELLGLSSSTVRGLIARGKLRGREVGGGAGERRHFIVAVDALFEFLDGAKTEPR